MKFRTFMLKEAEPERLPKNVLMYMPPEMATDGDGFKCSGCMHFKADGSTCAIMTGDNKVSPSGVCGMYISGKKVLDKNSLGYVGHATHCASCKFANESIDHCLKIQGPIEPNSCCNAWEGK